MRSYTSRAIYRSFLQKTVRYWQWKSSYTWKYWMHKITDGVLHNQQLAKYYIYFPMYTQNIKILSGWQKHRYWTLMDQIQRYNSCYQWTRSHTNLPMLFAMPTKFLNSLDMPSMPPHNLQRAVGSPVILLRNLIPSRLCNRTWLVIEEIMKNIIEAIVLNGKFRSKMFCCNESLLFLQMCQLNFNTFTFKFAMAINNLQGLFLYICGLDLCTICFSHRQLYVACYRISKPTSLFVCAKDWAKILYIPLRCRLMFVYF